MKKVRVFYSFPNKRKNVITTMTLLETEKDIKENIIVSDAAIRELNAGKQILQNNAGGWCWAISDASNGCNIEILPELELTDDVLLALLEKFESRADTQQYKGKKKRLDMQREFLIGAISVLDSINGNNGKTNNEKTVLTPGITFAMFRGEYITKENI